MAGYEMKDGEVSIFKNDKGDNPKRPDWTGKAIVNGEEMRISLWVREPKAGGDKYLSGEISSAASKVSQGEIEL